MGGGRHVRTGAETGVTRPPVSDASAADHPKLETGKGRVLP